MRHAPPLHCISKSSNLTRPSKQPAGAPSSMAGAASTLVASLLATANAYSARLSKTPNAGRACVPVGSGASPEGPQHCALREARTFTSFRFSHSRFALRPERRDPPGIAGNESNSRATSSGQDHQYARELRRAGGCRLRLPISRPGLQLGRVGCSPGITEPTLALRALRQVSALFRPRP